ncbi:MAG: FecR domain-containing protein [Cyanobacteria bacterium J06636_16]
MRCQFRWVGFVGLCYATLSAIVSYPANAEVPLTRASVEALANEVELIPEAGTARPARLSDLLSVGDAIRTAISARVDLRFNDGSLARIGEQATFEFVPNTRTFRLSNGTALFLIPPGQGPSTIETPSVVTGIHGTGLIVRHIPTEPSSERVSNTRDDQHGSEVALGRTIVMVLTDNPQGPVEVSLPDGQTTELAAGEMAIIDGNNLSVFEFDLALFYETSSLVEDLYLDDPNYLGNGQPTDPVRQETLTGLENQRGFVGEYLLAPEIIGSDGISPGTLTDWLVPLVASDNTTDAIAEQNGDAIQATPTSAAANQVVEETVTSPSPLSSEEAITTSPPAEEDEGAAIASPTQSTENDTAAIEINGSTSSSESEAVTSDLISPDPANPNPVLDTPSIPDENGSVSGSLIPPGLIEPAPEDIPAAADVPSDNENFSNGNPGDSNPNSNLGNDTPDSGPTNDPGNGPIDTPSDGPIDNPGNDPIDSPGEDPIDSQGNGPIENPDDGPVDNPGDGPIDNPGNGPIDNPGNGPIDNPGDGPIDNPGNEPVETP